MTFLFSSLYIPRSHPGMYREDVVHSYIEDNGAGGVNSLSLTTQDGK
jgi:hypothetical protein